MNEVWKTIDGFNGHYQVSNMGRVRSVDRSLYNNGCKAWQSYRGCVLKPSHDKGGYTYVILYDSILKKRRTCKIHRLVSSYFVDGYMEGLEVNHKNGLRDDNVATNLEWVTRSENIIDRYKRGYNPSGENNNASKLKNEYIPIIIRLYENGISQSKIAIAFMVSQATISNIITAKTYNQ